ncbi:hypothetical protein ACP70R_040841 [Stipagrostis hirtigluma subsp. patula]
MEVQVQRTFVIPASSPPEEVPLTVFDLITSVHHVTVLYAFSPPTPTNGALLDALSATLPRFPILTARLDRGRRRRRSRPCFVAGEGGGAGALVVEAAVLSALSDHLPLINRFACGGLVIATSENHQAADGYSMSTFLHAWADAVRGGGKPPALHRPAPYGPSALVPRVPPRCEFEHRGAEFLPLSPPPPRRVAPARVHLSEIANLLLHYTGEFVAKLKASTQNRYTTFETLSAHLWKKITAARAGRWLAGDPAVSMHVTVDGRARLAGTGAMPEGFFGNAVLFATSTATASDLAGGSLADAAALVRASIRAIDGRYFQSFIDFGAMHGGEVLEPTFGEEDNLLLMDVDANSWLRMELHRLDFGCGGQLAGILPAKIQQDGEFVLIPSLRKEGGVEVLVALWEKNAELLRDIAYTLD